MYKQVRDLFRGKVRQVYKQVRDLSVGRLDRWRNRSETFSVGRVRQVYEQVRDLFHGKVSLLQMSSAYCCGVWGWWWWWRCCYSKVWADVVGWCCCWALTCCCCCCCGAGGERTGVLRRGGLWCGPHTVQCTAHLEERSVSPVTCWRDDGSCRGGRGDSG